MKRSQVMVARRTLFVLLFALWQGGFLFYAGIVVPVGTRVLESATTQGFITQQVTIWLNGCGSIALLCWLWVLLAEQHRSRNSRRRALAGWGLLMGSLLILAFLHQRMAGDLDASTWSVLEPERFYHQHRLYLIVSTLQWMMSIGLLVHTIRLWSGNRRANATANPTQ